ncbi:3-methyl-2-oxobutanoate dehydrogenase subunit VorB [Desulfovibrio sp. OttesenSCG-928-C14]|nr:3-methyl-2-oxobutanoate dehydrogenase subunit VorB [Desulfovibrio sp. OttesenSCG-928-C14]
MMSEKTLMKGNEAIAEGAIIAGCRYYFGYPITPQSEIPEYLAWRLPEVGGVFLQGESELASINMVYGAAAGGARAMTSSSGPGISLKLETIGAIAAEEIPCVIVNVSRGGPGVGCIQGSQGDYFQSVKGGGNGDYRLIVYAPSSVQEMMDLTLRAFDKADEWRNPVMLLSDGNIGQMMESVEVPEPVKNLPPKPWAATGWDGKRERNVHTALDNLPAICEPHNLRLQEKYKQISEKEVMWEEIETADADIVLVGFGICARIAYTVMNQARKEGIKVGIFRPITLWPYPYEALAALAGKVKGFLVVEQNAGQMLEDVKLAVDGKKPVEFHGRMGGSLPQTEDILAIVRKMSGK